MAINLQDVNNLFKSVTAAYSAVHTPAPVTDNSAMAQTVPSKNAFPVWGYIAGGIGALLLLVLILRK